MPLPSLNVDSNELVSLSLRAEQCDQLALARIISGVAAATAMGSEAEEELLQFVIIWSKIVQDRLNNLAS